VHLWNRVSQLHARHSNPGKVMKRLEVLRRLIEAPVELASRDFRRTTLKVLSILEATNSGRRCSIRYLIFNKHCQTS
jgi:hypothetical protein